MNLKHSGKAPDILKAFAVLLAVTLTGCQPQTVSSGGDPPVLSTSAVSDASTSYLSDASTDDNTHTPDTSDVSSKSDDTESVVSAESADNSDDASGSSSSDGGSSTDSGSPSTDVSTADTSTASSEPPESSSDSSSSSEPPASSSSSEPDPPPESSSSAEPPPASSSSTEPEPPPEVVIPDVKVPTSPGSQLITGSTGVIDCSNASLGYVSARYTGSSSKLKFRVEANGQTENYDLSANGSTEYFPLTYGNGTYTLTIFEQLPGSDKYGFAAQGTVEVQLSSSLSPYLYPNRYVSYGQDSDCVYKAAELCAGKTSDIDKISAIFTWVANNISYDYALATSVTSGYTPDPDRTLSRRTGICFDYASLMAAMLRSQSIPTRLVIGYASPDIYHAWNEVYTEQTGWITPELMFKNTGYNLADATFYSSSSDKAQIAAYISNNGNYAPTKYR